MEIPNTYLFTAYYDNGDGTVATYEQGSEDRSVQEPENPARNSFYDILYKPFRPVEDLFAFRLTAIEGAVVHAEGPRVIGVNLRTGLFEADGVMFALHNHLLDDYDRLENIRLIYYRDCAPEISTTYDKVTGKVIDSKATGNYTLGYVLGWQAKAKKGSKERNLKKFIMLGGVPVKATKD